MLDYRARVSKAVQHFWKTRARQQRKQVAAKGTKDQGSRRAVTGGAQLDGFIRLLGGILQESGLPDHTIFTKPTCPPGYAPTTASTVPGYFRPEKNWDLVVVVDGQLLASIEFKSHIGPSFGNNFNNRVEEALGNATDLLTAYREGAFKPSQRPWLGWLMLLEDAPKSRSPVRLSGPHFAVFQEFDGTSYARRYELFCERLVRERLYDATCLLLSDRVGGLGGDYTEPNPETDFRTFATSLTAHAMAYAKLRER